MRGARHRMSIHLQASGSCGFACGIGALSGHCYADRNAAARKQTVTALQLPEPPVRNSWKGPAATFAAPFFRILFRILFRIHFLFNPHDKWLLLRAL